MKLDSSVCHYAKKFLLSAATVFNISSLIGMV